MNTIDNIHNIGMPARPHGGASRMGPGLGLWLVLLLWAGCATKPLPTPTAADAAPYSGGTIQIGDVVRVTFPGATNLNFSQQIRVDGALHLDQSREIHALGKTAGELTTNLLEAFGPELLVKEVSVVLESSGFPVFVAGAVLKPGKVTVNRSVTLLEAIMEAGGFIHDRANLRKVQIIRQEKEGQRTFVIDLQSVLDTPNTPSIHLKPSDVVIVPERFIFF